MHAEIPLLGTRESCSKNLDRLEVELFPQCGFPLVVVELVCELVSVSFHNLLERGSLSYCTSIKY